MDITQDIKGNLQQAYFQYKIKWKEIQSNSTNIRNKTRFPTLFITIQYILETFARASKN